jgi:hypothetical protein
MLEHMIVKAIKEQVQPEITLTTSIASLAADVFAD